MIIIIRTAGFIWKCAEIEGGSMIYTLQGMWTADIGDGNVHPMQLPGTLDENNIGYKDQGLNQWHPDAELGTGNEYFRSTVIATRFTRKYTYEGEARFTRSMDGELWEAVSDAVTGGKRIFLEAERARVLRLLVDGAETNHLKEPTISTPQIFEVTGLLEKESELMLVSDNSYPGLPHDAILYSSAATDETQTNWNGVLGYLRLRTEEHVFLDDIRVYPMGDYLTVKMKLYADRPWKGTIRICCEALKEGVSFQVSTTEAVKELVFEAIPLRSDVRRWDMEEEGNLITVQNRSERNCEGTEQLRNLYEMSVSLTGGETKTVTFGVREFGDDGHGRLALNGRRIFLRCEANCAVFPETGHPPMTVAEWVDILERYRSYGVNCVRFHSHCPPEVAFIAADQLGMLLQPELSHWNPKDAFESEESNRYYTAELTQILAMLANHPSFVMLTFGNELHATQKGHERMRELLKTAKSIDPTRLYADASNAHYGEIGCEAENDFYTAAVFYDGDLRGSNANAKGAINECYPNATANYEETLRRIRNEYKKPVFSFEVGQFEVLPDFEELNDFKGISDPANLRLIQSRVKENGLCDVWKKWVDATGELSRIGYRAEVEAAMRTKEFSGISLLGLQDFPGQGTALVGMMNAHLQPKPYEFARPEHFRSFFRDQLPLVLLARYTWENTETLIAPVQIANYGKADIEGTLVYELTEQPMDQKGFSYADYGLTSTARIRGELPGVCCPCGAVTDVGVLEIPLDQLATDRPLRMNLKVWIGETANLYPIWVYPPVKPQCPEDVYEARYLDETAKGILKAGGKVYLSPPSTKEALPDSIQAQFTTDFWSVGTFAGQEGGMGQYIDESHPIFERFPTEYHTNWQWWPMATQRAVILPQRWNAIITEMDSYAFLRPMAQLMECRCGNGKLLFSSLGLQNLQQYPEARALQDGIYHYMNSENFLPEQKIDLTVFEQLVQPVVAR